MDFFQIVEWTTIIVTFVMMLSGIPPLLEMYKTKETKNFPLPFFLVCLMNSMVGLYYGVLLNQNVLKVINSVGSVLSAIYSLTYIWVSKQKSPAVTKLTAMLVVFVSQIAYLIYIVQEPQQILAKLGTMLFLWSNIMVLTPVLEILEVIKQKNSDGVPVTILFGGLLCSLTWCFYGYLLNDVNIYGPNIVGNIINLTRLALLIIYRGGNKHKVE